MWKPLLNYVQGQPCDRNCCKALVSGGLSKPWWKHGACRKGDNAHACGWKEALAHTGVSDGEAAVAAERQADVRDVVAVEVAQVPANFESVEAFKSRGRDQRGGFIGRKHARPAMVGP